MEAAPTCEAVYQGVYALYNNPDNAEKEKASKWLDLLQKSVGVWTFLCCFYFILQLFLDVLGVFLEHSRRVAVPET